MHGQSNINCIFILHSVLEIEKQLTEQKERQAILKKLLVCCTNYSGINLLLSMGLSVSLILSAWQEILRHRLFSLAYNISVDAKDCEVTVKANSFKKTQDSEIVTNEYSHDDLKEIKSLKNHKQEIVKLFETNLSFKDLADDQGNKETSTGATSNTLKHKPMPTLSLPEPAVLFSPRPVKELDAAAVKLQKVYKSYRTRRNLADCAVVVEELWWKALDFAALKRSSVSFFNIEKPETAVQRWSRARTRVAKLGKGLSKDDKAQKLALQHWLEAIDPRHRYGHNLHMYYDIWFDSESTQPFFYWLDVGDGKEVNIDKCPRTVLQRQCIAYLGPKERQAFEVVVEYGKLVYRQSGMPVETVEGTKWIFVLSTTRALYVGPKKKGSFQHSSFLSGGATTAAGRLVAHNGILEAIWPYSGHYHPTEENFREFISFLEENHVDLTNVKRCAIDDDNPSFVGAAKEESKSKDAIATDHQAENVNIEKASKPEVFDFNLANKRLSCKWTTGTGPRIGCVRDYPTELQSQALEQVKLSPRPVAGPLVTYGPIPSPRPSPRVHLSPRLAYMGLPSPRTPIPATC